MRCGWVCAQWEAGDTGGTNNVGAPRHAAVRVSRGRSVLCPPVSCPTTPQPTPSSCRPAQGALRVGPHQLPRGTRQAQPEQPGAVSQKAGAAARGGHSSRRSSAVGSRLAPTRAPQATRLWASSPRWCRAWGASVPATAPPWAAWLAPAGAAPSAAAGCSSTAPATAAWCGPTTAVSLALQPPGGIKLWLKKTDCVGCSESRGMQSYGSSQPQRPAS